MNPVSAVICRKCSSQIGADTDRSARLAPSPYEAAETIADPGFDRVVDETLAEGTVLADRYQILRLIGRGGMGAVYKAYDRELHRDVALKTIRAELASQQQGLERFKREVNVCSRITHRNVVRIYDLGASGKLRFLTMEFIEGQSLDDMIGPLGLPPERVASTLRQVCLGLEAAHEQGVVDRDLKPQDIMIDSQGRVAVMDFGLASTVEGGGLTRAGALLGTPDYVAGGGNANSNLYNPSTNSFSSSGGMGTERTYHTATLLAYGKVLIAGGSDNSGKTQNSAQLYDPATGNFSVTGNMSASPRLPYRHAPA